MSNYTIRLDEETEDDLDQLANHFKTSRAGVFRKALGLLDTAAKIEKDHGELIARKGKKEITIILK